MPDHEVRLEYQDVANALTDGGLERLRFVANRSLSSSAARAG
ncbi:hypothetical protein RMN56_30120 [Micromonospora halotolerans]|uniref:Uncharacterized protein n=1 Tax=Micromonospora halotolerans TaxID=709879 RepID=A0ABY9ZWB4_9ACTN|nr:hypothetical protein [Micromonospora halotolerans]WNM39322.1 hypothetical protein RMN56_30120 [Micromonospora halotolerans]